MAAPYCVRSDLANYIAAAALSPIATGVQDQACIDASSTVDSYLRGRYALPLSAWGTDLRRYTAWVAIYYLMSGRGFSPQGGADRQITERYYMAVGDPSKPGSGWLPGVQRQSIHPDVTPAQAQPGDPVHDVPQVITSPQRGWTRPFGGTPRVGGF
jgi:phage gp36-like protein